MLSRSNRINEVSKLLEIQNCIDKKTGELTIFEQVKVLIGMSIMHNPKVIFLDNALSKLTNNEVKKLFKLLDRIKTNTTICITSSDMEHILSFDNVIVINEGKTLFNDIPNNVLQHDNELARSGFYIPPMIDLSLKLSFYGLVDEIIVDVDRMVDTLWK